MDHHGRNSLCPRLVDYIVFAGSRCPASNQHITRPLMLRRYPTEDHKDFALPFEIAYFCQPEGNYLFKPKTSSDVRRTTSFTFCLTDKDTSKIRHGVCLNFFRPARHKAGAYTNGSDTSVTSSFTLTSICIISHHPFLSTFRECLQVLHTIIDSCDYRTSSHSHRGIIWELFAGQLDIREVEPHIAAAVREIESWILRFLCAPVPVPGKTRLEMELLPLQSIPILHFGFPDRTRFPLVDYPLHLPFELLGVDLGLKVLACILLENKVVLRSKDVNAVSMTVMAYVAMLYPLEYMFPVIPLLPACMPNAEQLLLAPTPYIIGVPESFASLKNGFHIPDDVWLVDLDANQLHPPSSGDDLPPLPDPEGTILRNHLEDAIHAMSDANGLKLGQNGSTLPGVPIVENPDSTASDVAAMDVATRVAIVRFLNSPNVLGNLTEHVRTLRLHPRPVIAFQVYSFLRSRPVRSIFMDRFAKTQAVEFFAEYSLNPTNVAFLRVQTGISEPRVVGDKLKWFTEQLEPIYFQTYESNCSFINAIARTMAAEDHLVYNVSSDTYGANSPYGEMKSRSLDYSRADFQDHEDVERLSYQTVTPGLEAEMNFCKPPDTLQVPANLMSHSSSFLSASDKVDSNDESSRYSSPEDGPANIIDEPQPANGNHASTDHPRQHGASELREKLMNFRFGSLEGKPLKEATAEQLVKLDKTVTELADKSKQNFQKAASLFKSLSNKDQSVEHPINLKISITGSDPNTFVSDLGTKLKQVAKDLEAKQIPKPYGPFVSGRRNPNEKKAFIRHDNTSTSPSVPQPQPNETKRTALSLINYATTTATDPENQAFLKEICDGVLAGESVGWLKLGKLKKLLEDESYRNYISSRLNINLSNQVSDSQIIEDVLLSREQWKSYQKILQSSVSGLEKTFQSWGLGGMGSAFTILEIAYTHFCEMRTEQQNQSTFSSFFQRPTSITPTPSEIGSRLRPSESFGVNSINSENISMGIKNVMNNVRTLTHNTTSILISAHEDPPPGPPSQSASTANSPPSSPDTEGPDSPSASRRSSQSMDDLNGPPQEVPHRLHSEVHAADGLSVQYLDPERSPYGSPSSSRRSSRSSDGGASGGSNRSNRRLISHQSILSFNSGLNPVTHAETDITLESYSRKSSLSSDYRYRNGQLILSTAVATPAGSMENARKVYLFEGLIGKNRSKLFDQPQFWDDAFIDAVMIERDLCGMDQAPSELIEHYRGLGEVDKKRMEHDEDRLLTTMLYNLVAFMVAMQVEKKELRKTARRLLGKSHLSLIYSQEIHRLLEQLDVLNGNEIDLKPPVSRQTRKQTFVVHNGTDNTGDMCFLEVRDDGVVVRSINGTYMERVYYDTLVNMTYSPKTKVLCLWHKPDSRDTTRTSNVSGGAENAKDKPEVKTTQLNQFYCKKSKDLYYSVKEAMERAAARGKVQLPGADLGGDFPIQDMKTGEGGLLQVTMDGVGLLFANSKYFVQLSNIRKCFTQKGGIFILEEFDPDTLHITQRKYRSPMADQICYSVLCLFSYIAAGSGREPSRPSS